MLAFVSSEFPAYKVDELLDMPFTAIADMAKMAGFMKRMKLEPLNAILSGVSNAFTGGRGAGKPKGMVLTSGGSIPPGFAKVKTNGRKPSS